MYAAPDMGPFSGAYAAGFFSLAEKSSLEKNLGPFCCHKNTSFCMTCILLMIILLYQIIIEVAQLRQHTQRLNDLRMQLG